jgi:hyaluronan synthase
MPVAWVSFYKSSWGTRNTSADIEEAKRKEEKKKKKLEKKNHNLLANR